MAFLLHRAVINSQLTDHDHILLISAVNLKTYMNTAYSAYAYT